MNDKPKERAQYQRKSNLFQDSYLIQLLFCLFCSSARARFFLISKNAALSCKLLVHPVIQWAHSQACDCSPDSFQATGMLFENNLKNSITSVHTFSESQYGAITMQHLNSLQTQNTAKTRQYYRAADKMITTCLLKRKKLKSRRIQTAGSLC